MAQLIEKKRLVGILRGFDFAKVQRVMEQTDAKWLRVAVCNISFSEETPTTIF